MVLTEEQVLTLENNGTVEFDSNIGQYLYITCPLYQVLSSVINSADIIDEIYTCNIKKKPELNVKDGSIYGDDWQLTSNYTAGANDTYPLASGKTYSLTEKQVYPKGLVLLGVSTTAIQNGILANAVKIGTAGIDGHSFGKTTADTTFSIHGKNQFNITVFDKAIYPINQMIAVKEEMSFQALRSGRIDPNEVVNDAMISEGQLYAYQMYNKILNDYHDVRDGEINKIVSIPNLGFGKKLETGTPSTKQEYFNAVYDAVVTDINKCKKRGVNLGSSVILASNYLINCLQLSYKRMGTGDLAKEEIEQGFAGKVNGVLIMEDSTLGYTEGDELTSTGDVQFIPVNSAISVNVTFNGNTDFTYPTPSVNFAVNDLIKDVNNKYRTVVSITDNAGVSTVVITDPVKVTLDLLIIDVRPTNLIIKHLPVEKLRLQPGDSKEFDIIRAKAGEKWNICIKEPRCVSAYSLAKYN